MVASRVGLLLIVFLWCHCSTIWVEGSLCSTGLDHHVCDPWILLRLLLLIGLAKEAYTRLSKYY